MGKLVFVKDFRVGAQRFFPFEKGSLPRKSGVPVLGIRFFLPYLEKGRCPAGQRDFTDSFSDSENPPDMAEPGHGVPLFQSGKSERSLSPFCERECRVFEPACNAMRNIAGRGRDFSPFGKGSTALRGEGFDSSENPPVMSEDGHAVPLFQSGKPDRYFLPFVKGRCSAGQRDLTERKSALSFRKIPLPWPKTATPSPFFKGGNPDTAPFFKVGNRT